jgi:hypothetical protein
MTNAESSGDSDPYAADGPYSTWLEAPTFVVHVIVAVVRATPDDWTAEMTGPRPLSNTMLSKFVHHPLLLPTVIVEHVPSQFVAMVTRVLAPTDCDRVV